MPENQNRDYAKYDAMTTEELEEILRLDASAPEGEESDTELLLHVMGVLADRRNNTSITGNTTQQAWESFQQNYLPDEDECPEDMQEYTGHRTAVPWMRRLIAAAAVIVLVIVIPVSARALSFDKLWNVVARWAKETFSFVSSEDAQIIEPSPVRKEEYTSLQEVLENSNKNTKLVPTWIPEGFGLEKVEKNITPVQETYTAYYMNGDKGFHIQVFVHISSDPINAEISGEPVEIYTKDGIDYYIFHNYEQLRAIWFTAPYECDISGDLTLEEIKMMIDSIEKG